MSVPLTPGRPALVLFDMDGVLVETVGSYRRVIVEVVRVVGADRGRVLHPTLHWVSSLKRSSGFNNDWDASLALARGALEEPAFDVEEFSAALARLGGGLRAVEARLGPTPSGLAERVRQVFQWLYLGPERYAATEVVAAPSVVGAEDAGPYLDRESPLVPSEALVELAQRYSLGIATGRPRAEAHYALERAGWGGLIGALVTHDDCVEAGEPGKPHPWPLLEAQRRMGGIAPAWYVGDTPDDMRAALAAGMVGVGVASAPDDAPALMAAGAQRVVGSTSEACALLLG